MISHTGGAKVLAQGDISPGIGCKKSWHRENFSFNGFTTIFITKLQFFIGNLSGLIAFYARTFCTHGQDFLHPMSGLRTSFARTSPPPVFFTSKLVFLDDKNQMIQINRKNYFLNIKCQSTQNYANFVIIIFNIGVVKFYSKSMI